VLAFVNTLLLSLITLSTLAKSLLNATRTLRPSLSIPIVFLILLATLITTPILYVVLGPLLLLLVVSLFLESRIAPALTASRLSIVRAIVLLVKERLIAEKKKLFLVLILVQVVEQFVLLLLERSSLMRTTRFSLLVVLSSLKRT
jgi:hypothetical protein